MSQQTSTFGSAIRTTARQINPTSATSARAAVWPTAFLLLWIVNVSVFLYAFVKCGWFNVLAWPAS